MKILRFDLLAFGPFTGVSTILAEGSQGLHVIYGPNEAGKSSALRALTDLFFGIPERTADDFVHPKPKLRLGARIRRSDGAELAFLRHKARKVTLTEADGVTPLSPVELDRYLGGVDEERFRRQFGIDHDEYPALRRWARRFRTLPGFKTMPGIPDYH